MFTPLSNAVSFQNTFSYTSRGFLWFSFAPLSSTVITVNIHPFWVSNAKVISVILCAQVAFLSVRKKSAWISWHFWKQHKALIFLYTWVTFIVVSKWIGGFFCASHLFLPDLLFFFLWLCLSLLFLMVRVNVLFTDIVCVFSSRSKCGERDELSPKRIKIEVQYCDSCILTYAC